VRWQPADVPAVHGRQRGADRDGDVAVGARELELLEPGQTADEGRLLAFPRTEPERGGGVGHREVDAFGARLEPVGEMTEQEERGGPERR